MQVLFLWFMLYSFVGWLYESSLYTLITGRPVNSGFLKGPFCPIYGIGAVIAVIIYYDKPYSNAEIFITAFIIEGTFEFIVGTVLEAFFHKKWWDYSELKFNIKGRVCLLSSLAFAALVLLLIRFIHPAVFFVTMLFSPRVQVIAALILLIYLFRDLILTVAALSDESGSEARYTVVVGKLRDGDRHLEDRLYNLLRTSKTLSQIMDKSAELSKKIRPEDVSREYVKLNIGDIYVNIKERIQNRFIK